MRSKENPGTPQIWPASLSQNSAKNEEYQHTVIKI